MYNKHFLALLLLATSSFAVNTDNAFKAQVQNEQKQQQQKQQDGNGKSLPPVSTIYPYDIKPENTRFSNPQILKDRFELDLNENFSKNVLENKDKYSKILTETIDTNLLVDSIVKQIKNTDVLYLHPHFLTTISFPVDTEIVYANASLSMDKFDFSQNLLVIQPPKDFVNANILVTFRDSQRTYYTNIIVQKYNQNMYKDTRLNRYVIDDNYLSLNYNYVRNIEYSPIEVLKTYFRLNGDRMLKEFKRDGYYDIILIDGVSFYITRDSRFGSVDYQSMRFNVSQQYNFADKSIMGVKIGSDDGFRPTTETRIKSK